MSDSTDDRDLGVGEDLPEESGQQEAAENLDEPMDDSDDLNAVPFVEIPKVDLEHEPESISEAKVKECKTCHKRGFSLTLIDGECRMCAFRRMRMIDEKLSAFKQIKPVHKYCARQGHRLAAANKVHPDWAGKITVNGVDLYPVSPLCQQCIDVSTAYIVYLLEQWGFIRKGSEHVKNEFGEPYGVKLSVRELAETRERLFAFMHEADVSVLDRTSPVHDLFSHIIETRKRLMKKAVNELLERKKQAEGDEEVERICQEVEKLCRKYNPKLWKEDLPEREKQLALEMMLETVKATLPRKLQDLPEDEILELLKLLKHRINPILSFLYSNVPAPFADEIVRLLVTKRVIASDYILKLMDGAQI